VTDLIPRYSALFCCRHGYRGGVQACVFIGYKGDRYLVRKWRRKSLSWTDPIVINKEDLLSRMTNKEARELKVDRLLLKVRNPDSRKAAAKKAVTAYSFQGAV